MSMNKYVGIAILIFGVVLTIMGINARADNASPSTMDLWMLVGGLLLAFGGLIATWRSWKHA
jgi:drug/metabolite transporter (DMT)-like permease